MRVPSSSSGIRRPRSARPARHGPGCPLSIRVPPATTRPPPWATAARSGTSGASGSSGASQWCVWHVWCVSWHRLELRRLVCPTELSIGLLIDRLVYMLVQKAGRKKMEVPGSGTRRPGGPYLRESGVLDVENKCRGGLRGSCGSGEQGRTA